MRSFIFLAVLFFCGCEAVGPAVGAIGHGVGIWQRDNLIDRATEIGDTTAHNNQMLIGLCNKFEVDTAAPVPAETPPEGENPIADYAGLAGLAGLLGLLGKLAKDKRMQALIEKAAKEKLG